MTPYASLLSRSDACFERAAVFVAAAYGDHPIRFRAGRIGLLRAAAACLRAAHRYRRAAGRYR